MSRDLAIVRATRSSDPRDVRYAAVTALLSGRDVNVLVDDGGAAVLVFRAKSLNVGCLVITSDPRRIGRFPTPEAAVDCGLGRLSAAIDDLQDSRR